MDVSLANADSSSAGVDAGVPKPVNLLYADLPAGTNLDSGQATLANYTNHLSNLNQMLAAAQGAKDAAGKMLPGGSLRVTSASSRAITLHETFDYPLVIGYLGFDCVIQRGGMLGSPIPTHSLLDKNFQVTDKFNANPTQRIYASVIEHSIYKLIADKAGSSADAKLIAQRLDALQQFIPAWLVRYEYDPDKKLLLQRESLVDSANVAKPRDYESYRRYVGERKSNYVSLTNALGQATFDYQALSAPSTSLNQTNPARQRLAQIASQLGRPEENSTEQEASRQATSAALTYFIRTLSE
jgi:hypothetical protein